MTRVEIRARAVSAAARILGAAGEKPATPDKTADILRPYLQLSDELELYILLGKKPQK